jgi:hypothetical protein
MRMGSQSFFRMMCGALVLGAACATAGAQPAPAAKGAAKELTGSVADERVVQQNQEELIRLLRVSPTLTSVVERDPSLLADQEYVNRTNPELGRFLDAHPEVAKNPDFYLFSGLPGQGGRRVQALERKVWPENGGGQPEDAAYHMIEQGLMPVVAFLGFLGAVIWLMQVLLANRRWQRILKLQMDTHNKLIDRFGTSQELIQYMESEAGKRFLEAAPIPVNFEGDQKIPSVIGRVLMPLQIGSVMVLLGAGLLVVRHSFTWGLSNALLLMGIVILMPGIGFILSAGVTWLLAGRLGLMPPAAEREGESHAISVDRR